MRGKQTGSAVGSFDVANAAYATRAGSFDVGNRVSDEDAALWRRAKDSKGSVYRLWVRLHQVGSGPGSAR